jgi:hypothetical protein
MVRVFMSRVRIGALPAIGNRPFAVRNLGRRVPCFTIHIMTIYFDATDIAHWAGHSDRVTGIQRVELNIVRSLARDHGGEAIRGIFFDRDSRAFYEFDPARLAHAEEFSAESLLIDLGLQKTSRIFPSQSSNQELSAAGGERQTAAYAEKSGHLFFRPARAGSPAKQGISAQRPQPPGRASRRRQENHRATARQLSCLSWHHLGLPGTVALRG